jgi:hypothetical protein
VCWPAFFAAHGAYDFEEFAACLRNAFSECKNIQFLSKFMNFKDTVEPFIRNAANNPGADNFSSFR